VIDKSRFKKSVAKKDVSKIGWFLYYIGVIDIYLDYQVWTCRFRKSHPLSWLCYLLSLITHGLANEKEIRKELFKPKSVAEGRRYRDAE
jgi:hypothetical protein